MDPIEFIHSRNPFVAVSSLVGSLLITTTLDVLLGPNEECTHQQKDKTMKLDGYHVVSLNVSNSLNSHTQCLLDYINVDVSCVGSAD